MLDFSSLQLGPGTLVLELVTCVYINRQWDIRLIQCVGMHFTIHHRLISSLVRALLPETNASDKLSSDVDDLPLELP